MGFFNNLVTGLQTQTFGGYTLDSNGNWVVSPTPKPIVGRTDKNDPNAPFGRGNPLGYKTPKQDNIVKTYGPRGQLPIFYITDKNTIIYREDFEKKNKIYVSINSMDCKVRVPAIDERLLDIDNEAKRILNNLAFWITDKKEQDELMALIPLVAKLVNPIFGTLAGVGIKLNGKPTEVKSKENIQRHKNTLLEYDREVRKLLDLKKGCEGNLPDEDLLPDLVQRSANLTTNELLFIIALILVAFIIYKKRKSKK